jgi:biofilm PGA synthesis N-glycosyltransferase PgaC
VEVVFWLSLIFVVYTYFGYPVLLVIMVKLWGKPVDKKEFTPSVTMIIAAHNEEQTIRKKLENALDMDYPKGKFDIIVMSDGSSDRTDDIVREFFNRKVRLIRVPERSGKAHAINTAVPEAQGEIILFADARQYYDKNAIIELVRNFNDSKIGAVSGELYLVNHDGRGVGEGVGTYWKYEKLLRKMESRLYSTSGATGAIYAIRKDLYRQIPDDTILDDVVIPMNVVLSGYRVVFEENANAYDKVASTAKQELYAETTRCFSVCLYYSIPSKIRFFSNSYPTRSFAYLFHLH